MTRKENLRYLGRNDRHQWKKALGKGSTNTISIKMKEIRKKSGRII
jgi:hypothetical protein